LTRIQLKRGSKHVAKGVERFAAETSHLGLTIVEHTESTHTAQEAADAVGAPVGAIVKSLLFIIGLFLDVDGSERARFLVNVRKHRFSLLNSK